jgi:hypothetical protein
MATRKSPSSKSAAPEAEAAALASNVGTEAASPSAEAVAETYPPLAPTVAVELDPAPGTVEAEWVREAEKEEQVGKDHAPRFHFFIIDTGWKSVSAKVIRDNFHMIREFQNSDPLYVLSREQSIALVRANPDLIGKDPIILVHDLHAKGGRGDSGYHGFRLCLGLIKNAGKALNAMQEFLRFVHHHRRSANIEKDIRQRLHRQGLEGAIEVIREGASELME